MNAGNKENDMEELILLVAAYLLGMASPKVRRIGWVAVKLWLAHRRRAVRGDCIHRACTRERDHAGLCSDV